MDSQDGTTSAHPARMPNERNGMILSDGAGGVLTLDLGSRDIRWLAEACHQLTEGSEPDWARMLKVRCANVVYLLVRHEGSEGRREIEITNMARPRERVRLTSDLANLVASLIERTLDNPPSHMAASA